MVMAFVLQLHSMRLLCINNRGVRHSESLVRGRVVVVKYKIDAGSWATRQMFIDLPEILFLVLAQKIVEPEVDVNVVSCLASRVVGLAVGP